MSRGAAVGPPRGTWRRREVAWAPDPESSRSHLLKPQSPEHCPQRDGEEPDSTSPRIARDRLKGPLIHVQHASPPPPPHQLQIQGDFARVPTLQPHQSPTGRRPHRGAPPPTTPSALAGLAAFRGVTHPILRLTQSGSRMGSHPSLCKARAFPAAVQKAWVVRPHEEPRPPGHTVLRGC